MVKKVKKFNYQKDRKKDWKRLKAKKNPKVNTDQLKNFWDQNKSIAANYMELGLAYDPNMTAGLEIPKTKTKIQKQLLEPEFMEIEKAKEISQLQKSDTPAIKKLLHDASLKAEPKYNLNENDIMYCIYMIEKFGDDYKKMAKDHKNYYQDTPAQLRKRIALFKQMKPHYENYLNDKKEGVNFLEKLDETF